MGDLAWIERSVGLRDGRWVRVRAVRADDEAAMLALLESLSLESRRRRFFSVAVNLPEAARLASHSSWPEAVGLVALADETVVAHALAIRTNRAWRRWPSRSPTTTTVTAWRRSC